MRYNRSIGITPSEKLLSELCDTSFLKLWSYPNLHKKPGKELCDLLVVFGNDIILFSDKSCAFPRTGNLTLDWVRWYRRSISDSVHQLSQAERWLRTCPDRIFLDAACTEKLPVPMPPSPEMRTHYVCVALGANERAEEETGKRTLTISTCKKEHRFQIGKIHGTDKWVHVLDETNLSVLLREMSTTSDFLEYLRAKEGLFSSGNFSRAESELDLMAYFLWHGRKFPIPVERFKLDPDLWQQVDTNAQFIAGRVENRTSYFWDGLIEYFTSHYLDETLETGNDIPLHEYERGIRAMAAENRFHRRILSKAILERADRAKDGYVGSILPSSQPETHYVLLIGPGDAKDHASYRKARAEQLYARCIASKAAQPGVRFIVGLGLDAKGVKGSSEDLIVLNTSEWSEERISEAQKLRQDLGYFVDGKMQQTRMIEDEYPN